MSSELLMKYGKDFVLTEKKTRFVVLRSDRTSICIQNKTEHSRFMCLKIKHLLHTTLF